MMIIKITIHAKERMAKNAITKEMVKRTIKEGAKQRQTEGFLASYSYFKVAYKKIGENTYKIKTVYIK